MDWREYQYPPHVEKAEYAEFAPHKTDQIPQKPQIPPMVESEKIVPELDMFDPEIIKTPRTGLLTEVELEAFNGWYTSCRKPEFEMNHEEATLKSWELLIESMRIIYKEEGRRI